jgi:N-acetylglucosaminyldiphosphoundecaprenol N-acetyl-beta-D-mannosaminyltransferase
MGGQSRNVYQKKYLIMITERFEFLGTRINATNLGETTTFLKGYDFNKPAYVSFPDSSVLASAQNNLRLREILNNALLTLPDGKPSEFYARMKGYKGVSTVSGYWLAQQLFQSDLTHYFLGSTEEKLKKIIANASKEFPSAKIVGYRSPAFHDIKFFEEGNLLQHELNEINAIKPDLIWVGIGSPKQDFIMNSHLPHLHRGVMLGVGGVFDYLSGDVKKSPEWVKKIGMRWLWRLAKEPKRLSGKYATTFKTFFLIIFQKLFSRT